MNRFLIVNKEIADMPEVVVALYVYHRSWMKHNTSDQTQMQFLNWTGNAKDDIVRVPLKYKGSKIAPNELLETLGVKITKVPCNKGFRYHYTFSKPKSFFVIDIAFLDEIKTLGLNKWAFLLKLRALCYNDNFIGFNKVELAKRLGISRPTLNKYLNELSNYVTAVDGGFVIKHDAFIPTKDKVSLILDGFSRIKGSKFIPTKWDKVASIYLKNHFNGDLVKLLAFLSKKFINLPPTVTSAYFLKSAGIKVASQRKNHNSVISL